MDDFLQTSRPSEDHWMSVSDMMTALMMIFLFIAVSYMIDVRAQRDQVQQVAVTFQERHDQLYRDLYAEFKDDLIKWRATISKDTLSVRFQEPDVLFERGSAALRSQFQHILDDFFPRYVRVLLQANNRDNIEEIRIEGHTSSEWHAGVSLQESYFLNMSLSQKRTLHVLQYVLNQHDAYVSDHLDWLRAHTTANGLSFSKRIMRDGEEDREASRRVEFRVRTQAERQIRKILAM